MMHRQILAGCGLLVPVLATQIAAAPKAPTRPAAKPAPATSKPPSPPPSFDTFMQDRVALGVGLIQKSASTFAVRKGCLACHHQLIGAMAVGMARDFGFKVDEAQAKTVTAQLEKQVKEMGELVKQAQDDPAVAKRIDLTDPLNGGYIMSAMLAERYPRNEISAALARHLAKQQEEDGRWPLFDGRPPMDSSELTTTALAVRALKSFSAEEDQRDGEQRIARARAWMLGANTKTTEDLVFRLFGLVWSGATAEQIRGAQDALLAEQQDDGGWGQLPGRAADAYATGEALVALHESGMPTSKAPYQRGELFLLMTQQPDGSWRVPKRAHPIQPYFESGYPHGKDQFVSMAGACWATMALVTYVPAPKAPAQPVKAAAAR